MKIKLKNYNDIKAIACIKGIKMETELPKMLGYKSRWGLKMALNAYDGVRVPLASD